MTVRRQEGFTLVEMLVSLVLLGILFAVFSLLLGSTIHQSGEIQEEDLLQTEVRGATDRLVQDLRQVYTGDATSPILSIGPSQITFLSPDRGSPTFHLRKILYQVTGDHLDRSVARSTTTTGPPWTFPAYGPAVKQITSIADPAVFSSLDANGAATTTASAVRTVTISVLVATGTSAGGRFTYRTSVGLRTQ